ncbi:ABC transporter ATP-binding protein [Actinomadura darangshiensis]|uniref:ABC transporter ATP-binding protein n=1 Tax=Actinomadura darangshiensis TaxID=705336 RepID=A0A4R5BEK0_9ACTN|nr:ABC transporter ATP-binding protein [Actinomadura darangshiensis]TDD83236.1 ABC transporter ATP-binding protein [Actinomadura darangshiensis]
MMLEIDRLTAGYGRVRVLHEVSLDVGEGEIVALVGPNGAGKSTLLRAVTAMIPDRSGTLVLAGRSLIGASVEAVAAAGVAHVPEGRRLFPGLTVRDNLRLGGWLGRNKDLAPVLEMFPVLGDRLSQVAGSLSGGEQQMCAIARALMSRPKLLLIDELSLGLAPLLVDEILARLGGIAAAGTGILLVEQDAGAALEVAHRGYVLELGEVVLAGTTAELAADPRMRSAYLGGEWEADAASEPGGT